MSRIADVSKLKAFIFKLQFVNFSDPVKTDYTLALLFNIKNDKMFAAFYDSYLCNSPYWQRRQVRHLKFGPSEKGTKFEKIFHFKFDATE